MKARNIVISAVFILFIYGFMAASLLQPTKDFSELENRTLSTIDSVNLDSICSGRFMDDAEGYINDHIALRDVLVRLNTAASFALGIRERNGSYYSIDGKLRQAPDLDTESLTTNVQCCSDFAEHIDIPVVLALVPGAASLYERTLPYGVAVADQSALIDETYALYGGDCADICSALLEHGQEYIYYNTDHHWTTLGAYYGYAALCETLGITPLPLDVYIPEEISNEFYGTLYSKAPAFWIKPDSINIYVPDSDIAVYAPLTDPKKCSGMYDLDKMAAKDKYGAFLCGNQPVVVIETQNSTLPRLLLLRDSYSDSMAPFLTPHFSQIHLIDVRYYKRDVLRYIQENMIDAVAVVYSLQNISSDTSLSYVLSISAEGD